MRLPSISKSIRKRIKPFLPRPALLNCAGSSRNASNSAAKDAVWNALGAIDSTYSASDINIDVQVAGLAAGAALNVATEEGNLNIRQEPSTEAAIAGKAAHGSSVTLVEQTSDEWWKVRTADGVEGYAYARYLQA